MNNSSNACCNSEFGTVGMNPLAYVGGGAAHPNPKYAQSAAKGTMGRGASPTGTMASRSNVKLNERTGPKCTIVASLYKPNAAEASATQRNTRIVPSKAGVGDFFSERMRTGQLI